MPAGHFDLRRFARPCFLESPGPPSHQRGQGGVDLCGPSPDQDDSLRATERLFPLTVKQVDWNITQVVRLMGEARQAFWLMLVKNIVTVNQQHWPRALQMASTLQLELPRKSILFILRHCQSSEALIAALHMASGLSLLPIVRRYLQHPDWRVRVEVARFLSSFGDTTDIPSLTQFLKDKEWGFATRLRSHRPACRFSV